MRAVIDSFELEFQPSDFKVPVRRQGDGDNGDCNDEQASQ